MQDNHTPLLEVRGLSISFTQYQQGLRQTELHAIRDLNLRVHAGEMVAVVGASGSGKSLLAHGILGILPYNAVMGGGMLYKGETLTQKRKEALRGNAIALVPQGVSYLDPLMQTGAQIRNGRKDKAARQKARDLLGRFGLDEKVKAMYPFELSGGMARRVLISMALMESPELIIADEPTPGLHLDVAKRVLSHFREMADAGAGVLLITHDLQLAAEVADRIVVFYAGTTVEDAAAADFAAMETLRHPYTRALWRAMPEHGFEATQGAQPYAAEMPAGCPYAPRCKQASAACAGQIPYLKIGNGYVRCILPREGKEKHGA